MKSITEHYDRKLNESSLSRLWKHNELHDCGALTAFRKGENCGEGRKYTTAENNARNKSLAAKLKSKGYGITRLKGTYPEGGEIKKEESFFVVDLSDKGNLENDLKELGEFFDQDSVLIIPKGSINNEATAFLVGTNHCKNNWLKYGETNPFSKSKIGYNSEIYTSKVNGRPFIFESVGEYVTSPASGFGVWSMHLVAEKDWTELIESDD